MACYKALCKEIGGATFAGTAGLSLGEWSALHMAGVLSFEDTLRVLEARGRFMQEACEERQGGMVSVIGLASDKLKEISAAAGVEIANLNSPEQTVLSGERGKIQEADKMAKAAGASRTVILNVAGAFHSSLMASAAKKLEAFLAGITFGQPCLPVVANATGRPHGTPEEIRRTMVRQVTSSVQWVSSVQWFKDNGINSYVECGPGKVLSGLVKRIDKDASVGNIQDCPTLKKAVETVRT
jgi:[acyl-carrier-protein] S-malonyltransferase